MTTLSETIEKVRKLLALSTSSNANEAAAAAGIANKLIDEHRLSVADLENTTTEEPVIQDAEGLYESGRITPWKTTLVRVLTQHYGVAYYNDARYENGRKVSSYRMVGRASDMSIVRYMFAFLSLECTRLSSSEVKGSGRVSVASYQEGFVCGVADQLKLSREEIKKQASSNAIVKIDSRLAQSKEGMYSLIPGLRSAKAASSRRIDANAFDQGKQRGKSIHLGSAMSSGSGIRMLNK